MNNTDNVWNSRAPIFGTEGWEFEPLRARQSNQRLCSVAARRRPEQFPPRFSKLSRRPTAGPPRRSPNCSARRPANGLGVLRQSPAPQSPRADRRAFRARPSRSTIGFQGLREKCTTYTLKAYLAVNVRYKRI
jgi:hypothetical protein